MEGEKDGEEKGPAGWPTCVIALIIWGPRRQVKDWILSLERALRDWPAAAVTPPLHNQHQDSERASDLPKDGRADVLAEPEDQDDFVLSVGWHRVTRQFCRAVGQYDHVPKRNICTTNKTKCDQLYVFFYSKRENSVCYVTINVCNVYYCLWVYKQRRHWKGSKMR